MRRANGRLRVTPADLRRSASLCRETLMPVVDADWSLSAGDLEWDCRRTVDHLVDVMVFYAGHLATRATERRTHARDGDPKRTNGELLVAVETTAAMLAEVARAAPADARAFHPAGMADAEGFLAMGCIELLIHTDDVAHGLAVAWQPPEDVARRVADRIFPWAPTDGDAWDACRWAAGRIALPDRPRLDPDWYWHCAPLAEWDGTIKKRTRPPGWV